MSKQNTRKIEWYEPTNDRRKPYATMNDDGVLWFGLEMQNKLPRRIRIGFQQDECSLCVEANTDNGYVLPANGSMKMLGIAMQLQRLGIELPAHFLFVEEEKDLLWKGYIVPPPRKPRPQAVKKTTPLTEHPHLLNAYKWLIDKAVYTNAKSTPMEERRAIAQAALWEALGAYTSTHGPLKDYLYDEIKKQLTEKNKQYVSHSHYRIASLDALVGKGEGSDRKGYDLYLPRYTEGMTSVENRLDFEFFQHTHLDQRERQILKMLLSGYSVSEIQIECRVNERELDDVCRRIGDRWGSFYQDDNVA